ncbi:hypothetical protein PG999_011888 [Apiospora kogelbergensis]|uniref:Heterokaryon incompatibility domain-containing protein n=1 Tax=Apiospora kogelbergensis TaxID=1337665 RepID=A0AAW0QGY0_9PEZI
MKKSKVRPYPILSSRNCLDKYSLATIAMEAITRSAKAPNSPYTSLKADEFRLLLLKPGTGDEPLECLLIVCNHQNNVPYEALSYAWGNLADTVELTCNSIRVPVTVNLEGALRHLRSPTNIRVLWVDALCIDQSDSAERSDQIRLMKSTFSEARRVLVWLGPSTPDTEAAFKLINRVVRTYVHRHFWRLENVLLPESSPLAQNHFDFSPSERFARVSKWDLSPLIRLLQLPWFTRLWVFQEVAFAKEISVVCGEKAIPWWRLAQSVMYLQHKGVLLEYELHDKAMIGVKAVAEMEKVRQNAKEQDMPRDLISILLATSAAQCTDPRDKIYGVLGLVDQEGEQSKRPPEIEIDYDADVAHIYQDLAEKYVAAKDLRILSCVSRRQTTALDEGANLPSWVPDWTAITNDTPFVRYNMRTMFPGAQWLSSKQQPEVTSSSVLRLPCIEIDQVESVVPVTTFTKTRLVKTVLASHDRLSLVGNAAWIMACRRLMAQLDSRCRCHNGNPESKGLSDILLSFVLAAGLSSDGHPIQDYEAVYHIQYMAILGRVRDEQRQLVLDNRKKEAIAAVEASIYLWSSKRLFGITKMGRAVLVPPGTCQGDRIILPAYSDVPVVVRRSSRKRCEGTLLGEAFVPDIMSGDYVRRFKNTFVSIEDSPRFALYMIS